MKMMIEAMLGLLTVIGLMFAKITWDRKTIKNQKQEIAAHEKKDEIIEDMGLAKIKLKEKQDEALENNTGADYMDRL